MASKRPRPQSDHEASSSAEMPSKTSQAVPEAERDSDSDHDPYAWLRLSRMPRSKRRKLGPMAAFGIEKIKNEEKPRFVQDVDVDLNHMITFFHPDTMRRLLLEAALASPALAFAVKTHHELIVAHQTREIKPHHHHHLRVARMLSIAETMTPVHAWSMAPDVIYIIQTSVKEILVETRAHVLLGTKKSALRTMLKIFQTLISKYGTKCGKLVCQDIAHYETMENAMLKILKTFNDGQKERFRRDVHWVRPMREVLQWGKKHRMFQKIKDVLRAIGLKVADDKMEEERGCKIAGLIDDGMKLFGLDPAEWEPYDPTKKYF
ncbi:MAG: hypothetical protein Q9208_006324 [Pyrenodesmia sp. 3 TL-2023]